MLQRAASNAYSWWWASHIRTTQSKWLDSNLQEMEEKVKVMIKLIEADADSFAKKAELYFRRRPELINHVEEVYRAYKALADKYDRISGELHKANRTIATAFPDQVPLALDDDESFAKAIASIDPSKLHEQAAEIPQSNPKSINEENLGIKKTHHKRISSHSSEKAEEDVDKLQKEIIVLQTEKEFVKSSYQNILAKYWDIERQITEKKEEICSLQDTFNASAMIEDDDARALMAATAIKSCEDSLITLHEKQKISIEGAQVESERIKDAKEKLKALKIECGQSQAEVKISDAQPHSSIAEAQHICVPRLELQSVCQKIKEHFEINSELSVVELVEKIDELVDKVISLESTVSSQTAQIDILRSETDGLQKNIQSLEEEKTTLKDDSNELSDKLKQTEEDLRRIQLLEKRVQDENGVIQTQFTEACRNFNDLSEKLQFPKHQEHVLEKIIDTQMIAENIDEDPEQHVENNNKLSPLSTQNGMIKINEQNPNMEEAGDVTNLQEASINVEGKDLLAEYTTVLQSYKETKKKLSELEKNQERHEETIAEVKELKISNAMKDDEIHVLRQLLSSLQPDLNANALRSSEKYDDRTVVSITKRTVAETESSYVDGIKLNPVTGPQSSSASEDKLRADIDGLVEENLDFWLRFSTLYHQIQKYQTAFVGLQGEIEKLDGKKRGKVSAKAKFIEEDLQQETVHVEKRLRELNTELQVWLEKNAMLKGELQCRFSSICNLQDVISKASKEGESQDKFSAYQTAKFQGEILDMKLENSKVANELQAGLDHVRGLQVEVGRALAKLHEFELSAAKNQQQQNNTKQLSSKTRVPLRTFLFGTKPKKTSIFSRMSPATQKKRKDERSGTSG